MNAAIDSPCLRAQAPAQDRRLAQALWNRVPLAERLRTIAELRHLIAEDCDGMAAAAAAVARRPVTEKLVSEVLPLADACRWLETDAERVLAPRRCGRRGRPFWLRGVNFEVQRQAHGVVLVIGPANYPLFLPAVHSLHALVAGNAVLIKPAPGTRQVALAFASLARRAGIDPALLEILPESVDAVHEAISDGVDKVIFTGSSENGRDVLRALAETNTPAIMELSGKDAVIVLADADLDLVVRALRFGSRLNGGNTCIAPRRVIVVDSIADELCRLFASGELGHFQVESVPDAGAAIDRVNHGEVGLGAAIFSRDVSSATHLASALKTGFVAINDLIVPTADPRLPFGGVKASGFGVTRGDEGLLEMTYPHVVVTRSSRQHPHFDQPAESDAALFSSYIRMAHGRRRFCGIRDFVRALRAKLSSSRS